MAAADAAGAALTLFVPLVIALIALFIVLRIAKSEVRKRAETLRLEEETTPDRAYNVLVTSEAISREMQEKGIESSKAEELLRDARHAYLEGSHEEAIELSLEARQTLRELGHEEDEQPEQPEQAPTMEEAEIPESKPLLGKEYPRNYLQAKFYISLVKSSIGKGSSPEKKEARRLIREAKKAFDDERHTEALSMALSAKRALEGDVVTPKISEEAHCPDCDSPVLPDDTFCGECGAHLDDEMKCANCGSKLGEGDRFCRKCGAAVVPLVRTG